MARACTRSEMSVTSAIIRLAAASVLIELAGRRAHNLDLYTWAAHANKNAAAMVAPPRRRRRMKVLMIARPPVGGRFPLSSAPWRLSFLSGSHSFVRLCEVGP